jgi:hypothetical protein
MSDCDKPISIPFTSDVCRNEFSDCVDSFAIFMREFFKPLDMKFDPIYINQKGRHVLYKLVLSLGDSWPINFRGDDFASITGIDFELLCNKGDIVDGETRRRHYVFDPTDLETCKFLTDDVSDLHFSAGELERYNTYESIVGINTLKEYAKRFKNAVFCANLANEYIRAANTIKHPETSVNVD